jgi:sugar lactone lactonase YvrE
MKRILFTLGFIAASSCSLFAQVTTFSGDTASGAGNTGAKYDSVNYSYPFGIAYDGKRNLWVTDQANEMIVLLRTGTGGDNGYYIREGNYQVAGYTDAAGAGQSSFNGPASIVVDKRGAIYVLDQGNSAIRKIDALAAIGISQKTVTFAGGGDPSTYSYGQTGYTDAKGTNARFNLPTSMAYSPKQDALFVADGQNNAIRKIAMDGTVTTYLGGGAAGSTDGSLSSAKIDMPVAIYIDSLTDDMYFIETGNSTLGGRLRRISGGTVSTINVKISGTNALVTPAALAMTTVKSVKTLYIANSCDIVTYNMSTGAASTYAGGSDCSFANNNNPVKANFKGITSLLVSPDGKYMLVVDQGNNQIRKMMLPATVGLEDFATPTAKQDIYPNPANNYVMIPAAISGKSIVSLFDMAGKEVMNTLSVMNTDGPFQLNVTNVPAGIYTVRIASEGAVTTQRLVITHN